MIKRKSLYGYVKSKQNAYKNGGTISSPSDNYNQFNTGGSHEVNPFGGIPTGTGANGAPNTVEQGESSFDFEDGKYIFSDRLGFDMEANMVAGNPNQFAMGGELKGLKNYNKLKK